MTKDKGNPRFAALAYTSGYIPEEDRVRLRVLRLRNHAEAVTLAKSIIALHDFKPKADPQCSTCKGTGEYEEVSRHNGDFYNTLCDCMSRGRPVVTVSPHDKGLVLMARHYLK